MTWNAREVSEARVKFVSRAESGQEQMSALCAEFGISRPTGYLWLERFRERGQLGDVIERSRRPKHSPRQTAIAIEERVIACRKRYPDWGAAKLVRLLEREQVRVPRITVHRILLRNGLVSERDRHRAAVRSFERAAPNQLWQMDFKGMPEARKECLPLVILDDHSRYMVGLFATTGTKGEPVQECLSSVFHRAGMPDAMLLDHGTPWWNMQSQSGWTWLTVWLMRQGIRLYLSGYRHPQTQGKIERSNRSLEAAMRKRPKPQELGWQAWLDAYREEHNQVRPHEALQMEVPAQRWRPSSRCFVGEPKPWEYPNPEQVRKVGENGGISLQGHIYFVSRAFIGENVQLQVLENTVLVWFCSTLIREFDLQTGKSNFIDYGQFDRVRSTGF